MKKSNFITLISGTVSLVLFGMGMSMILLPEHNNFVAGIVFGIVGLILGLITILYRRKANDKKPIKINKRILSVLLFGIFGALVFGFGLCLCLAFNNFITGILIGLAGIILLLLLIPLTVGIK